MKLFKFTFGLLFVLNVQIFAQSPAKMAYQAVVRDNANKLVINKNIGLKISVLQGSVNGSAVYTETQLPTTNSNGLLSIEIGVNSGFASINWANGPYFIKTEIDISGGTNYTISGTTQLLSVPYAFHARIADSVTGGVNESDPDFNASIAAGISSGDTAAWNAASIGAYIETDPVYSIWDKSTGISITESQVSDLKSYVETENDPVYGASVAAAISQADTSAWNEAARKEMTETDPVFSAWDKSTGVSVTESQISDLKTYLESENDPDFNASIAAGITSIDTAAWNAASVGAYVETDPIYSVSVASKIDAADTNSWNNKLDTEVDGSVTNEIQNLSGVLSEGNDAGAAQIKNIADPTEEQDAVTKAYVDAIITKLSNKGLMAADVEGNFYLTFFVGEQVWMAENLKTTKYADGTPILVVSDSATWVALGDNSTDDALCYFDNTPGDHSVLYTWAAAMNGESSSTGNPSGIQGVCPDGWHLPSQAEWDEFIAVVAANFPGATGTSLKSLSGWNGSGNGTNVYGFTGMPIGIRDGTNGAFTGDGDQAVYWTATQNNTTTAVAKSLVYNQATVQQSNVTKSTGASVRCVKNE